MFLKNFFKGNFSEAAERLEDLCRQAKTSYYVSLNAYSLYWAERDSEFKRSLERADLASADGTSVYWASKFLGEPASQRVAGYDLACHMIEWAWREGVPVEFVGLRPLVLGKAKRMLESRYPGLNLHTRCVGFAYGRLQELQTEMGRGPRLVLAALPSPQQEKWISDNIARMPGALVMGVGGTLEALTGEVKRAPGIIQSSGFEWLYRFLQQPVRRWHKTFISTAWFGAYFLRLAFNKKWNREKLLDNSAARSGGDPSSPFGPN